MTITPRLSGKPGEAQKPLTRSRCDHRIRRWHSAVSEKVEALYRQGNPLPADTIGPRMARIRREHHRLLGNGYCTRPPELDCAFEAICETCTFFQTSIEFRPILQRRRDHAADHDQGHRADLFDRLLNRLDQQAS